MTKSISTSILLLFVANIFGQTLTINKTYFVVGEPVTIDFTGSTFPKDWVALFDQSITPASGNNVSWLYTSGTQTSSVTTIPSGTLTFSAGIATVGNYKAALLADDGFTVLANVNFTVTTSPAVAPVGDWLFDDPAQLLSSAVGPALVLVGSHEDVAGPSATDGAIRIGVGSHYELTHGLAPNNGIYVNTYSMLFDFKVNDISDWRTFLQANGANTDDGEVFIKPTAGTIGLSATGYSTEQVNVGSWNRLVMVVNNGATPLS